MLFFLSIVDYSLLLVFMKFIRSFFFWQDRILVLCWCQWGMLRLLGQVKLRCVQVIFWVLRFGNCLMKVVWSGVLKEVVKLFWLWSLWYVKFLEMILVGFLQGKLLMNSLVDWFVMQKFWSGLGFVVVLGMVVKSVIIVIVVNVMVQLYENFLFVIWMICRLQQFSQVVS